MEDPTLGTNRVENLYFPGGGGKGTNVSRLAAAPGVKHGPIEHRPRGRDFDDAPLGPSLVSIAGRDFFGGHPVTLRRVRYLLTGMLFVLACGGAGGDVDLPDNYREQLHAVTGHEPSDCTDLRSIDAVITLSDAGISPDCAIVGADQDVAIVNQQSIDDTWIVADPPTELELPRHTRLVFEVPAETTDTVERIGDRVGTGVWVCYGRESRHECQVVVAP